MVCSVEEKNMAEFVDYLANLIPAKFTYVRDELGGNWKIWCTWGKFPDQYSMVMAIETLDREQWLWEFVASGFFDARRKHITQRYFPAEEKGGSNVVG